MRSRAEPIANLGLRLMSLASKGLLIFFIAGRMSIEDVGTYGLVAAVSGYFAFFLGAEFYSYASRYYVGGKQSEKYFAFKNHIVLSFCLYGFGLITMILISGYFKIEPVIALLTYAISLGEHAGLEAQRFFNFTLRPVLASAIFFIRAGLWPIIAISLIAMRIIDDIVPLLLLWLGGLVAALIVAGAIGRGGLKPTWRAPVSSEWLFTGLRISVPLLIGTVALRSFFSLDRVLMALSGKGDLLAVYVVYASVINAVISLADAGVIAYQFPLAMHAARSGDFAGVRRHGIKLFTQGASATLIMAAGSVGAIWFLAPLLGKPIYGAHLEIALILAVSSVLYVAGQGPQAILFALRADRQAIAANLTGVAIFLGAAYAMLEEFPAVGVPLASCVGFLAIVILKSIFARSALRQEMGT